MIDQIHKCVIEKFNIKDAFAIVDTLADNDYMSVSCFEKNNFWSVEILHNWPIIRANIQVILGNIKYDTINIDLLKEENWLEKCFANFKPIIVGNFFIYGSHLSDKPRPLNKMAVEISAATAFGTGEHATTNRCLIACQTFFNSKKHKQILDLGCGSAILSIALARLGARNIFAYDNDQEAVKVSKENIIINKVVHKIKIFQNQSNEFSCRKYDFIVANILSEPLIALSESIVESLNDNGILVLSGFTVDDCSVLKQYSSLGLSVIHEYKEKDWLTVVFKNHK